MIVVRYNEKTSTADIKVDGVYDSVRLEGATLTMDHGIRPKVVTCAYDYAQVELTGEITLVIKGTMK